MFFARLRELIDADSIELEEGVTPATVAELRSYLCAHHGGEFAETLLDVNVFCAVNKRVVAEDHALHYADEIAFFPPVTGG
ncbi:MAG: molybdopterin synthase sulfur carrier subunit [Congregibacter sp.]